MPVLVALLAIIMLMSVSSEYFLSRSRYLAAADSFKTNARSNYYAAASLVVLLTVLLILFTGFRTSYNDTGNYITNYLTQVPSSFAELRFSDLSIGDNFGFLLLQVFLKQFISKSPQILFVLSSIVINIAFIRFYFRYAERFSVSIYLFITSGLFIFSMAATKQSLAIAIGLFAVDYAMKKKWAGFIILLILGLSFHPYVVLFGIIPFIKKTAWGKWTWLFIGAAVIGSIFMTQLVDVIVYVASLYGQKYLPKHFAPVGVNFLRVIVFAVTPVLSFIYRKKINEKANEIVKVSVNLSVLSFSIMLLALFGNAVMFSRLAFYFEPFTYIALPWILFNCINKKYRVAIIATCLIGYFIFFYYQFGIAAPFAFEHLLLGTV